jgi:ABC-type nitrate/sulfonate/bicarbonate transport system substrate-binding protein
METEKKTITVQFTFDPSILHSGLIVAQSRGYFKEEGLDVTFRWPRDSTHSGQELLQSAVKELTTGHTDVIIGGVNSVIYFNTHSANNKVPLVAISALCHSDATAVATLKKSNIDSLKKLEGKKVGLIGYPFEEGIFREMLRSEGANRCNVNFVHPTYSHLYDGLKESKYEAGHICVPWHGVRAKRDNVDLTMFKLEEYGIPRFYPCLVTLRESITSKKTHLRAFLKAIRRGYTDVFKGDPKEIARVLKETIQHDNMRDIDFIEEALRCSREYYHPTGESWGTMKEEDWKKFVRFLAEKKLLVTEDGRPINEGQVNVGSLFTNDLLG